MQFSKKNLHCLKDCCKGLKWCWMDLVELDCEGEMAA